MVPLALLAACGSPGDSAPFSSPSFASAPASLSSNGSTTLTETGSTLLLPLVSVWQVAYGQLHPNVLITASGTGSGTGIADAAAGTLNLGGSDASAGEASAVKAFLKWESPRGATRST